MIAGGLCLAFMLCSIVFSAWFLIPTFFFMLLLPRD